VLFDWVCFQNLNDAVLLNRPADRGEKRRSKETASLFNENMQAKAMKIRFGDLEARLIHMGFC
jgi:hypothetical protein